MNKIKVLGAGLLPHRLAVAHTFLLLLCLFMISTAQAIDVIRFTNRSLYVQSAVPGVTTKYVVSFTYNNLNVPSTTVGSIDMLFCNNPIPTEPCDVPAGLDVSGAILSDQAGETGFSVFSKTANHIVLTRPPSPASETPSAYTFDNMVNPTDTTQAFSIRLSSYSSTDATGTILNVGSVRSQVTNSIQIETQVPPQLIFCLGEQVGLNCNSTNGITYTDMGELTATNTLTATSQMAVGTNATAGFVITANGTTMQAGTNIIEPLSVPTLSAPGNSQFGINLVANTEPLLGSDPDGPFTNAIASAGYDTPNQFKFNSGDVVAEAPNVSLVRRFTVSYIVNAPPNLRAGVYTTTVTFICSGRF